MKIEEMKPNKKYVVFPEDDWGSRTIKEAKEDHFFCDYKLRLKKWSFILKLIFSKKFFMLIRETLLYALMHEDCYKGQNASDVYILTCQKGFSKLWYKD